ncbi:MAG: FAD-dependent oxidoreductase [Bacilli bacterium]
MIDNKDVAIIGMGPGGVSSAIYLKRYGMNPVCFEKDLVGGKTNYTDKVENYPGYLDVRGPLLATDFEKHLQVFDIKPIYTEVKSVLLNPDGTYEVSWGKNTRSFKYVILANGLGEKPYKIPGEENFHKRGISRCAICDGNFYKGKDVAVIGGGNAAFEEACYLSTICHSVALISHNALFKAQEFVFEQFKNASNTAIYAPYQSVEARGEKSLEELDIVNSETNEKKTLHIQGLFIYVGSIPVTGFLGINDLTDKNGFVITDSKMMTKSPHLYAIGDTRATPLRQIAMAVSDGALAATDIHLDYLKNRNNQA